MATVAQGQSQLVNLGPNDAIKVSTPGEAYVDHISGTPESPYTSTRLIKNTEPKVFGPYGANAQLRVRAIELSALYDGYTDPQPALVNIDPTTNQTVIVGADGLPLPLTPNLSYLQSYVSSIAGSVWAAAITNGSAKVAFAGHSIISGINQNYLSANLYSLVRAALKTTFPGVSLSFRNYGIGGTRAEQFLGVPPASVIGAQSNNTYRELWENDSMAASSPAGTWADKVAAFAPDLLFLMWDLNEVNYVVFGNALRAIINNINSGSRWAGKRPSIVLITSHTGLWNPAHVRKCHKVTRAIARQYAVPLMDAGRLYDILTTGIDPVGISHNVTGEVSFNGAVQSARVLPATLFDSPIGTAYSPTGTSIRDQASGNNPLRFYRKTNIEDGAVQGSFVLAASGGVGSLFYRVDPADPDYSTGTGAQYELRISGTTAQMYFWSGGSATAISGATGTLPTGVGASYTKFQARVEFTGAEHRVSIQTPNAGRLEFDFVDFSSVDSGYVGYGITGIGGGYVEVGDRATAGVSTGSVIETWLPVPVSSPYYSGEMLFGINDWYTNPASIGGNGINHLTNLGNKLIYEPAIGQVLKQLQV